MRSRHGFVRWRRGDAQVVFGAGGGDRQAGDGRLDCLSLWIERQKEGYHIVATEKSQNVQDVFLNHVRKNKTPVTVFLVNGVKLQGIITWFDNFSVLLRRDGHTQLVYKHAISTVMPGAPIQLFDGTKPEGTALVRETTTAE